MHGQSKQKEGYTDKETNLFLSRYYCVHALATAKRKLMLMLALPTLPDVCVCVYCVFVCFFTTIFSDAGNTDHGRASSVGRFSKPPVFRVC